MRSPLAAVLAGLIWVAGGAGAAHAVDNDHERAREALAAGQIRPLKDILASLEERCGGRVIEVELEAGPPASRSAWQYELRMMMPQGDVLGLDVDAATTQILQVRGHGAPDTCR